MQNFSAHIERLDDCEEILEYVFAACRDDGAVWFQYHFTPIFESPTSKSTFVWARDYPFELQQKYIVGGMREIDPVPRLTLEHGDVLTWRKAIELGEGDEKAERYFELFREMGVKNWAGFSLFGPRNRKSFAALTFDDDPVDFEAGKLTRLQSKLQTAHLRICLVIDKSEPEVTLSHREREVLEWMGRGKSSTEIGSILEISHETVKTYVKRIYGKLESNDRVTATVRALQMGLIEL